jgi:tRNA 2-thiouridine synthesizing protein B
MHSSDGLLLTQDSVYAVMDKTLISKLSELESVYVLQEDAQARGVQVASDKIQLISYNGFVELSLQFDKVISW